jgi:hypothetical protein
LVVDGDDTSKRTSFFRLHSKKLTFCQDFVQNDHPYYTKAGFDLTTHMLPGGDDTTKTNATKTFVKMNQKTKITVG